MASLQAVSDSASLDGGLAGSNQEVPINASAAKQRHRRGARNHPLRLLLVAFALAESRENVGMQGYRKWRKKKS